jgi:hypothetical protein|tara:strand:+ start:39213 stop:39554 length:342 start_codon:yes stop_codon:yes gene_type:complete
MSLISRLVDQVRSKLSEPEQRAATRESDPWLFVEIEGVEHRARDWSAGGACIAGCALNLAIGQMVTGHLRWHKRDAGHTFTAEIMRIDLGGEIALRWLDLPDKILADMEPAEG